MKNVIITGVLLALMTSVYGLNPSKEYKVKPSDFGLKYQEVKVMTEDSVQINVWYYEPTAQKTSGKMIILSDDGDGNMADLIELASNFLSLGYHVFTYDYRGYGASADFSINNSFYIYAQFEKDLAAVFQYVKNEFPQMSIFHLYGTKIGAGLSISFGANNKITKIIADSPYTTFEEMKGIIKDVTGNDPLLPLGYDKTRLEPIYAMPLKGWPLRGLLLIAGDKDKIYSPKLVKTLTKFRPEWTDVFVVKGATAETTFSVNKNNYFDTIKAFLDKEKQ